MDDFESSRVFRIWDWSISHSRLLLRSPRDERNPTDVNIDMTFFGVTYVEIPDTLRGVKVASPREEDDQRLRGRADLGKNGQYFVLESAGRRYYVGAVQLEVTENRLATMQSSLWRPSAEAPGGTADPTG